MSYSAALELMLGDSPDGGPRHTALPSGVPQRIERANVTLNHGLLVGELLGVPIDKVQRILGDVDERAGTDPYFHADELQTLRVVYSVILRALGLAIQEDGKPAPNAAGERLTESDLIITNDDGSLMTAHRRISLRLLREDLQTLEEFLSFAIHCRIRVRME